MSVLNTILLVIGAIGYACSMRIYLSPNTMEYIGVNGIPTSILGVATQEQGEDPFRTFTHVGTTMIARKDIIDNYGVQTLYAAKSAMEAERLPFPNLPKEVQIEKDTFTIATVGAQISTAQYENPDYPLDLDQDDLVAAYFIKRTGNMGRMYAYLDCEVIRQEGAGGFYNVGKDVEVGSPVFIYGRLTGDKKGLYGQVATIKDGKATVTIFDAAFQKAAAKAKAEA